MRYLCVIRLNTGLASSPRACPVGAGANICEHSRRAWARTSPADHLERQGMSTHEPPENRAQVRKFEHPGRGRERARSTPKGRAIDPEASDAIKAVLGDAPRDRHLLIEHLHRIQDSFGQISAAHLAAL